MEPFKFQFHDKIASLQKKVVVIDIGYKYTKLGFGGEPSPRCIIPTVIRNQSTGQPKNVLDYAKQSELYNNLVEFFHFLYFKKLLISPKDSKVIIVESLLCPSQLRETLAKVLFNHLQISSLLMLPSHMVALYTLAVNTALVLDIGHSEATLIPVYEGFPVLHAYQAHPLGGRAVEQNLQKLLSEQCEGETQRRIVGELTTQQIEDIKVRLCFVTPHARTLPSPTPLPPPPHASYPLPQLPLLTVPGGVREMACEVLFQLDGDHVSIVTMILDALLKCNIDMRRPLSQSIVLMGGTAAIPGIKSRILDELRFHLASPRYAEKLFVKDFKIHVAPSHENYTAWLGGSLVGATEVVSSQSVTMETYKQEGDIPDWASLKYNLKQENSSKWA